MSVCIAASSSFIERNEEEDNEQQITDEISTADEDYNVGSASLSDMEVQNHSQEDDAIHPSPEESMYSLKVSTQNEF